MLVTLALVAAAKQPFSFQARFLECCSCKDICVTEITGRDAGCHGIGAIVFDKGQYGGKDISGTAAAFAWDSGKWVKLYVDAAPAQRNAVTAFLTAFLDGWGKLEPVKTAKIHVVASGGLYSLDVKGIANVTIKPVLGADGKRPVTHTNLSSPFHSTLVQGETQTARFLDGHPFTLDHTNAFINFRDRMTGKL